MNRDMNFLIKQAAKNQHKYNMVKQFANSYTIWKIDGENVRVYKVDTCGVTIRAMKIAGQTIITTTTPSDLPQIILN